MVLKIFQVLVFTCSVLFLESVSRKPLVLSVSDRPVYNESILADRRSLINQFIPLKEVENLIELIKSRESNYKEQYNGTFVYGCSQLLYGDSDYPENVTITPHRMKLFKSLLKLSGDVSRYVEWFFNTTVQLQSCVMNIRRAAGFSHYLVFKNSNISRWTHGIHADQCQLLWNEKDKLVCTNNDPHIRADRHYTAVLYLNEVAGGDFAFVDVPQNHSYRSLRSLADIPAPPSVKSVQRSERARSQRGLQTDQETAKAQAAMAARADEFYITRNGVFTVVPPTAGKLVVFSSGAENIHGVTEVLGDARYVIYLWYNRV